MAAPDLNARRYRAAQASGGSSAVSVHALFLRVVRELALSGDLLDFGAGSGALARRLRATACFRSVTCVDLIPALSPPANDLAWHQQDLNEPLSLPDGCCDVLVAAEVIEHLENPRAVVRDWARLLRPGGTLLFSTPNNESLRSLLALLFRGHYAAFGDASYPAHITALLRQDIRRIAAEAGFGVIGFRFTDHGTLPKGGRVSWQGISAGRLRGLRFSDNLLAVCRKPNVEI